jgi:two-component system, cell cycle response regulator
MGSPTFRYVDTRSPALVALAGSLDGVTDRLAAGLPLDAAGVDIAALSGSDDVAQLVAAADRLLAAVQRAQAFEGAVHELFDALSSHLRLDYLSCEALYRVIDHTRASGGAVVLVGNGPPDVVASVEFDIADDRLAAVMDSIAMAAGPSQLELLEDETPIVMVPFDGDSGPLGAILLAGVHINSEMRRLLSLLARALGFAVSNALAHSAAEVQAATDALTGCLNRRAGLEGLAQMTRVATHGGPAVGVMMLDLDHFKMINDQHGHQVGDDVLQATGAAIAAAMRTGDIVMRYGGEEFLIAIADVDERALTASAERVSDRVRALSVPDAGSGSTVSVTASVGIAVSTSADNLESLIARADRALYAAKAAGRDRVVFQPAPELPAVRA